MVNITLSSFRFLAPGKKSSLATKDSYCYLLSFQGMNQPEELWEGRKWGKLSCDMGRARERGVMI